jgi:hypothetical protein
MLNLTFEPRETNVYISAFVENMDVFGLIALSLCKGLWLLNGFSRIVQKYRERKPLIKKLFVFFKAQYNGGVY